VEIEASVLPSPPSAGASNRSKSKAAAVACPATKRLASSGSFPAHLLPSSPQTRRRRRLSIPCSSSSSCKVCSTT